MNIRETFAAIRRAYRVAHSTPILSEGAIQNRIATTSALRAFTNKWDTFTPGRHFQMSSKRTSKRNSCGAPIVWAACTRWLKKN